MPTNKIKHDALTMLARRAFSASELFSRLTAKGHGEEEAEETVNWLIGLGYLDDGAYAQALAAELTAKGRGPRRVERELLERGLDAETARAAAECAAGGDDALAESVDALLRKHIRGRPSDAAERRRLCGLLERRGFSAADILAGLNRLRDEEPE